MMKTNDYLTVYRCTCGKCGKVVMVRTSERRPRQRDIMPKGWRVYVPRRSLKVEYRCEGCPDD